METKPSVTYEHIKRDTPTLLIYFNDMTQVGYTPTFSSFKTLTHIFPCDILFIKDIAVNLWYLTIIPECAKIIQDIISKYNYSRVFALATSSGTIPLLNIMPTIKEFQHGFIINGQPTLKASVVKNYSHCKDCAIFNPAIIKDLNTDYLIPLELAHNSKSLSKYTFYINNSISDAANYHYLKSIYSNIDQTSRIIYDVDYKSHYDYIIKMMTNTKFLSHIYTTMC